MTDSLVAVSTAMTIRLNIPPSCLVDNIWAVMIVLKIRGKIIRTVLCCIVYHICTYSYEQFLQVN